MFKKSLPAPGHSWAGKAPSQVHTMYNWLPFLNPHWQSRDKLPLLIGLWKFATLAISILQLQRLGHHSIRSWIWLWRIPVVLKVHAKGRSRVSIVSAIFLLRNWPRTWAATLRWASGNVPEPSKFNEAEASNRPVIPFTGRHGAASVHVPLPRLFQPYACAVPHLIRTVCANKQLVLFNLYYSLCGNGKYVATFALHTITGKALNRLSRTQRHRSH